MKIQEALRLRKFRLRDDEVRRRDQDERDALSQKREMDWEKIDALIKGDRNNLYYSHFATWSDLSYEQIQDILDKEKNE